VSKLPVISGADCVKALGKIGFEIYRQRGSHIVIVQVAGQPNHHSKSQGTRSRHPPRDHSPNRPYGGRIHHVALRTAFGDLGIHPRLRKVTLPTVLYHIGAT
jgi:hypothetical protein